MLLTELLFQRVLELGAKDSVKLKPGYVAIQSRAVSLRALIVAALFPTPDDAKGLVDLASQQGGEARPTRVGLGLLGRDGTPYRILREIGAARQLHKFDPQQKRFGLLSQDDIEIASFLRVESDLVAEHFKQVFLLGSHELPSIASLPIKPSANLLRADLAQAAVLKSELEQTQKFEEAQDKLFKVQQRILELGELGGKLETAGKELAELDAQLARSLFSPAQIRELTSRAQRAPAEQKKHTEQLGEMQAAQRRLEEEMPLEPKALWRDPLLWIGLVLGAAVDGAAFAVAHPWVALLGLLPFAAALVAVLRWIDAREQVAQTRAMVKRLGEREVTFKKAFADEQGPLRAALKAAGSTQPEELLELFKHRDEVVRLREQAKVRFDTLRALPGQQAIADERPRLLEEKVGLEMTISAQGFARPLSEIERDLRRAMGIITDPNAAKVPGARPDPLQAPRQLVEQAAVVLSLAPGELWSQLGARLGAYLAALTDKRIATLKLDAGGLLSGFSPDGRGGAYASMPAPLRDLTYTALRLALLERVAKVKRAPIFVDDTFAPLEPLKRGLVHKMLKSISADTQVLHRSPEPPPQNLADLLITLP